MKPKVSVIICTRGRPELLVGRSLPSVRKQTHKDYEVIVIENPSDKKYPKLPEWVRYYKNKKDIGLAGSKNRGIKLARGEYVVFLDDDNELHKDFLVRCMNGGLGLDMVCAWKKIVYPEGVAINKPKFNCSINDGFIIRKDLLKKIKFDDMLAANEDADFGIRFWDEEICWGIVESPLMTAYASPIFNTTSYSDYTDYHLDGLADFWKKHHKYEEYIGRMFLLRAGRPKWFKWLWWLEQKLRRYWHIYNSKW